MKKFYVVLLVLLLALIPTVVFAQGELPPEPDPALNASLVEMVIAGFVVSAAVVIARFVQELATKRKVELPDWVLQAIVYLAALGLTAYFRPLNLPPLPSGGTEVPDVVNAWQQYAGQLFTVLSGLFVSAHLWYKYLIVKFREALAKKFTPKLYKSIRKEK